MSFRLSCRSFLFFPALFSLPHSCGATAPQLWCNCLTAVVQLPHSCGATGISLEKTKESTNKATRRATLHHISKISKMRVSQKNIGIRIIRKIRVQKKQSRRRIRVQKTKGRNHAYHDIVSRFWLSVS